MARVHILEVSQDIPATIETVWNFFATPRNLRIITPPDMEFEILWGTEEPMYAGQLIAYRVRILPGWRVFWLTQITHLEPMRRFVDEQRVGPYSLWIHEHHFEPIEGGVRMRDRVTYGVPFGLLGMFVHRMYVRRQLERIFAYRAAKIEEIFPGEAGPEE